MKRTKNNARKAGQQIKVSEKYHEIKRMRRTISLIVTIFPVFKKDQNFLLASLTLFTFIILLVVHQAIHKLHFLHRH